MPSARVDGMTSRRHRMVDEQIEARGVRDARVLQAMRDVPRHEFVPAAQRSGAYEDRPAPIGEGQTISQPYMVAVMTEALQTTPTDHVLEVGGGSGYQAAVLAQLVEMVVSIERLPALAASARAALWRAQVFNAVVLVGDGSAGVPVLQPYDGILVAAGAPSVPAPLLAQLADGGRLVAPIGSATRQELVVVRREGGRFLEDTREGCVFVPLVGQYGWEDFGSKMT